MRLALQSAERQDGGVDGALASRLAPWIHQASNPFADWYFGDPDVARELIGEWMTRPSSELYVGRASLLQIEGEAEPAGALLGVGGAELAACRAADFVAFCQELGGGTDAEAVISEVVDAARTLFPPVGHDAFYISRVVVDPVRRGEGLGKALVERAMRAQARAGYQRFRLDVSAENAPAIRAYRALGFRVVGDSARPEHGLRYLAMERTG